MIIIFGSFVPPMPSPVTAFSVKITAPGEVAIKAALAREALYEWNGIRSWEEKKAFLPLPPDSGEGAHSSTPDLLITFFCGPQRTSAPAPARDQEIEQQIKSGHPVLVYLSEARTDLMAIDADEARVLEDLKKSYPAEVMIESFKDEKELRAKLAQNLDTLIRYHAHFRTDSEVSVFKTEPPPHAAPAYSKQAQALLMNACDDPEVYLARMHDSRGVKIQVNGRQFIEPGNAESAKLWDNAFNELVQAGLIRDVGCNGQLFQISTKGFEFLATLGKYPIGYIAELGGM
jgi:hypothetical protein